MNIGESVTFNYTGGIQTWTVPQKGVYKLEVWGGQGGGAGGKGGYSIGYKILDKDEILYIVCGQNPTSKRAGGYNGGGNGQAQAGSVNPSGWGGGGATHIATVTGTIKSIGKTNFDLNGLIIAGGGGGGSENSVSGGSGGGSSGGNGSGGLYGRGGTQTSGGSRGDSDVESGSFGQGGNNNGGSGTSGTYGSGGGGGGYYGGGAASWYSGSSNSAGGGGGSGWIGGVPSFTYHGITYTPSTTNGVQSGNGKAVITLVNGGITVSTIINPLDTGTTEGQGNYFEGDSVSLKAIPDKRHKFESWLLKGYTQLEYIESTGSQHIDTGILPTINTRCDLEYEWTSNSQTSLAMICGVRQTSSGSTRYYPVSLQSNNALKERYVFGDQEITKTNTSLRHTIIFNDSSRNVYLDGSLVGTLNKTIPVSTKSMWIFKANSEETTHWPAKARIFFMKIYEGTELVSDFIPVIRHSDLSVGLLDLVNMKFYGNSGTGDFIAGGIV